MTHNPFADPHQLDSNPFEDPSVQSGLHSNAHEDPYGGSSLYKQGAESSYSLPSQSNQAAPSGDVQQRLDDLARRERELADRERNLTAKQEHIRKHGRNNFPPGPWPLIYHDINEEIPEQHRATVLTLFRVWLFLIVTLLINLVAAILLLVSGASNGGADLGAAIMYVPVIGVLSFLLWYRPVYNAYAKEYAFFYYMYFIFAGFHLAFCVYMFVGIPSSGSGGLINLITRFASGSIVTGVFCILATVGWALEGLASLWMYKNVWAHSHGEQGHSLAQAKSEIQMYGVKQYLFGGKSKDLPVNTSQA
ncbi:secretory carrier-associated membrane protein [Sporobolomyces salmoneus]|uniref:secretory carrier-associated membrane protein n=1 Tax=Sporobolomyces salmoneus TaxID=183962 RepID=UPI00317F2AB6